MSGAAASPSASARYNQSSSTMRPSRSSRRGIHSFLKRFHAETAHDIQEAFIRLPPFDVHLEQTRNRLGYVELGHRGTDDLSQGCIVARRAADGDLVPLLAALIDAENADVTHMMMSAGIHAPRHLDLEFAQIVEVIVVVEPLVDELRHIDGAGVCQAAKIQSRTADHVGQGTDVRRGEARFLE